MAPRIFVVRPRRRPIWKGTGHSQARAPVGTGLARPCPVRGRTRGGSGARHHRFRRSALMSVLLYAPPPLPLRLVSTLIRVTGLRKEFRQGFFMRRVLAVK